MKIVLNYLDVFWGVENNEDLELSCECEYSIRTVARVGHSHQYVQADVIFSNFIVVEQWEVVSLNLLDEKI